MLSIHYVSIMMRIFYIDWQRHWECDLTMNIGANARYQQNSHKWQTWPPLTVGLPVTSERYRSSFQVTRLFHKVTVSQCNHFICCHICICCLKLHQADYKIEEVFFFKPRFGGGALSANVFTICAVYWSLGRRGYFGISNVALVNHIPTWLSFMILLTIRLLISLGTLLSRENMEGMVWSLSNLAYIYS